MNRYVFTVVLKTKDRLDEMDIEAIEDDITDAVDKAIYDECQVIVDLRKAEEQ